MDKRYINLNKIYDKTGRRRPGVISNAIPIKREKDNPADKDSENRCHVVDEIEKLVKEGITVEDACKNLVEKYKDNFKYLPENALAQIFNGWYNGRIKDRDRKSEGRIW